MDAQLIRYLDGELSDEEAMGFLARIDREPELRRALEEQERLLEAVRELPNPIPSADFADRVMIEIRETPRSHARTVRLPRWTFVVSAAAMVLLAFALGRNTTPPLEADRGETASLMGQPVLHPDFSAVEVGAGEKLRIVQLVYAPQDNSPAQVSLAGSFNGWKAGTIPMRREGDSWTATLILPPGTYEYMFLEDDTRWVTDPRAPITRDDGFGGRNAILDVDA